MPVSGRISGKDIAVTFGGTSLTGDITSVGINQTGSTWNAAGAAETHEYPVALRKDTSIDMEFFYDSSTTTVWNCLLPLTAGTLIVYPKGTTATYPKWTWATAIVTARNATFPFDNGARYTCTFVTNGTVTEGTA